MAKTPEEKAARRRELALHKRNNIARIRALDETARTSKEQETLMIHEERRIRKNILNRERQLTYKAKLELIEEKSEDERSSSEIEFLKLHTARRERKNERNRLLRLEKKGETTVNTFTKDRIRKDWPSTVPVEPNISQSQGEKISANILQKDDESKTNCLNNSLWNQNEDNILKEDEERFKAKCEENISEEDKKQKAKLSQENDGNFVELCHSMESTPMLIKVSYQDTSRNSLRKVRDASKRKRIQEIQEKPSMERTLEEQAELSVFNQRRLSKNEHNRRRRRETNEKLKHISGKPALLRSQSEKEFMDIQLERKQRKLHNDRLRRERKKAKVKGGDV